MIVAELILFDEKNDELGSADLFLASDFEIHGGKDLVNTEPVDLRIDYAGRPTKLEISLDDGRLVSGPYSGTERILNPGYFLRFHPGKIKIHNFPGRLP